MTTLFISKNMVSVIMFLGNNCEVVRTLVERLMDWEEIFRVEMPK
jgi:hypothetical protein